MTDLLFSDPERIALLITGVISAAAVITSATKTPKDDAALKWLRRLLDVLALNVWNARNADPPDKKA